MAIIQLYGNYRSVHTQNVIACLNEKQIEYEFVSVDFSTRAQKQPTFLALNPFGQVPVIRDGDFTLFESRAIIKYIAQKYEGQGQGNNLVGRTLEERALVEQWCQVESQRFSPMVKYLFRQHPCYEGEVVKVLDVYEQRLSKCAYLAGDFFSAADLLHLSQIDSLIRARKQHIIASRSNVNAWWERISSRPAWKKVLDQLP